MRSETEIREKLGFYEKLLTSLGSMKTSANPGIDLRRAPFSPIEIWEMLQNHTPVEVLVAISPVEDEEWIGRWFNELTLFARQVLESRITILKWVLENQKDEEGVTGGQGI